MELRNYKCRRSLGLIELIPNMPLFLEGGTSCNNNGMGAYEIVRVVRYVDDRKSR